MNELNPGMAVDERSELLKKIQDKIHGIEMDFQAKKPAVEELLRESEGKQEHILNLLNERMRQLEGEKTDLANEIQGFKESAQAAQAEKEEAEKAAQAAQAEKEEAERAVQAAQAEKEEAERAAQSAQAEKEEAERAAQAADAEKQEAEKAAQAAQAEKEEAERAAQAAQAEKAEMEIKLLETTGNMEHLDSQIKALKDDLNKSITIAETAVREKAQLQGQLNQFQEHWEKHVAGK